MEKTKQNSIFILCPMPSPWEELINHIRQAISLDDFPHKPVYEFTHGLVLHISSKHKEVSHGSPRGHWPSFTYQNTLPSWWLTGKVGEETSSFGELHQYENGQLHLPKSYLC